MDEFYNIKDAALKNQVERELSQMAKEQCCAMEELDDAVIVATIEEIKMERDQAGGEGED